MRTHRIRTDQYGDETDFFVLLTDKGELIWDEWDFDDYNLHLALREMERCATLDIFGSYGDGSFAPGKVKLDVDGTVKHDSGNFGDGIFFCIGDGC